MWDFSIQTDHIIEARRPNLVVVDKERSCKIIDFAIPGVSSIEEKEQDKIEKYQDLGRELQKEQIKADGYYSRNSTISEDSFTWNG